MQLTPRDAVALASSALAAVALGAAGWVLLSAGAAQAGDPVALTSGGPTAGGPTAGGEAPASGDPQPATSPGELVVDVQGAVARPGLVRVPPGARVADAIAAAGGYSDAADLLAAAASINLAATLSDGEQVFVPITGMAGVPRSGTGTSGDQPGLVNLNAASPEALEALPGIGPVTVQKIVAARQEQPFATLEELIERKVMNRGQLEGIRDLVTI